MYLEKLVVDDNDDDDDDGPRGVTGRNRDGIVVLYRER